MADTKISDLTTVATPAASDEFAVNQGGLSKKVTLQQISGATGNFSPIGTSRISRTDATHIALGVGVIPLLVNSIWQTRVIGTAVSIDTTGLAVNTIYFVYAADNAGSTVIELSTTGHSTDTAFGVETKTGDATRTYVGVIKTDGSSQFTADLTNPWFGEPKIWTLSSTGSSTTSSTMVDVTNGAITVLPHSTASRFKVVVSVSMGITNVGGVNTQITTEIQEAGSTVTNSARTVSAPSSAGGNGATGNCAWSFLGAPASAATVIYKLRHLAVSGSGTASTSNVQGYIQEVRE